MEREKRLRLEELEKIIPPKEKRFIEELEADGSKADAAIRAGYGRSRDGKENRRSAATAASRILAKPEIAEYRALRAVIAYEETGMSRDTVMSEIVKVYRRCMQGEPVLRWDPEKKDWVETGEWRIDSKGALKALELMGEHVGAFEKENDPAKNKIDVNINVVDKASATSDIVP